MRTPFALAASATAMLLAGCSDPARGSGTDDLDQTDIEGLVDVRTDLDPDQPDDASNIDADIGSGSDADQPGPDPAGPCDDDADCPTGTCVVIVDRRRESKTWNEHKELHRCRSKRSVAFRGRVIREPWKNTCNSLSEEACTCHGALPKKLRGWSGVISARVRAPLPSVTHTTTSRFDVR